MSPNPFGEKAVAPMGQSTSSSSDQRKDTSVIVEHSVPPKISSNYSGATCAGTGTGTGTGTYAPSEKQPSPPSKFFPSDARQRCGPDTPQTSESESSSDTSFGSEESVTHTATKTAVYANLRVSVSSPAAGSTFMEPIEAPSPVYSTYRNGSMDIPYGIHVADPKNTVVAMESLSEVMAALTEKDYQFVMKLSWTNIMTFPVRMDVQMLTGQVIEFMIMPGKTLCCVIPISMVSRFHYYMANEVVVEEFRKLAAIYMRTDVPNSAMTSADVDKYLIGTLSDQAVISANLGAGANKPAALGDKPSTFRLHRRTHRGEAVWYSHKFVEGN
eukprot:ANDGO_06975.mRNA.1 hypothetical protein